MLLIYLQLLIKTMKKLISLLAIVFLLSTVSIQAQQIPQFSQRMFDKLVFNPAVAGSVMNPEIKLHYRSQWVGFDGAPVTSLLNYHRDLSETMGLGGYLISDIAGHTRRFALNVSYAYHIPFQSFYLSMGLSGSLLQYGIDGKDIKLYQNNDNSINAGVSDKVIKPDASLGIYLYNNKFYFGASVLQLINSKVKLNLGGTTEALVPLTQHYYITGGYNFIIDKYDIEPSMLLSRTIGSPTQIDINVKLEYSNKIIAGITYRNKDAVILLAGFRIERFFMAYSYDIVVSSLKNTNSGSHEILLSMNFPYYKKGKGRPMYNLVGTKIGQIKKRLR